MSDSEDDDAYRLTQNPPKVPRISEKKRIDVAAFRTWVSRKQGEIASAKSTTNEENARDSSTDQRIIETPREYQIDLFETAKKKNIIVVLDTGSGKTLIAVLLLHHVLTQELEERKKATRPNKVAFFVVEKVALCFQQHKVLEDNLEFPIGRLYGDMTGMINTKESWDGQFAKNMAIVTTAQVLLDCLNNGFISIRQINLLIFDEAHHAKKNHPYARIIKNHYTSEQNTSLRPRILGLTASPVDTQTRDMQAAALELESMLCSEIATVSNEVLAESLNSKNVVETTEVYDTLPIPEDSKTSLWDRIRAEISGNPSFRPALDCTLEASSTLGPWCADRYWTLLLTDLEVTKFIAKAESQFETGLSGRTDHAVSAVQNLQKIIRDHRSQPVSRKDMPSQISSKVELLWQIMESEFRDRGAQRCIVFVEKRYTAVLLADLLQQPSMQIPGVVSSYMVGSQSMASSIVSMSVRDQVDVLANFERGDTNCLFATPVGEEGIDIPECDLVIRFDMYNSVIQYIQSRGRARQANSRFISLVERGNIKDLRRLKQAVRDTTILQKFCLALPEDRKVQDMLCDITAAIEAERVGQKSHEIKDTGARLSFENSLGVLARFTSSLGELGGHNLSPEFVVIAVDRKKFAADVILPETSPVNCVSGFPQRSKQLARCSAAYEACLLLLQSKYIDNHLQPAFTKKLPLMRNARLATSANKKSQYTMRIKPELWLRLEPTEPLDMFLTVLTLESPSALGKPSRPLILLTRKKLSSVSSIPLFFGSGHSSAVRLVAITRPLRLTPEQLEGLRCFTLKIFADIFSKEFEAQSTDMPYFFAPCGANHDRVNGNTRRIVPIDWDLVHEIKQCDYLDWEGEPEEFFCEKLVVDPWDGSRKLVIHGINPQLKPGDRVPDSAPKPRSRSYRSAEPTIKEYSNSLFLKARQSAWWRDDQPVLNAEIMSLRRNFLDQFEVDEVTSQSCYIILEPLKISPIPMNVVNMAILLPAILYRLDASLVALDACSLLGLEIRPDLALEAITKDSDNTDEHGMEQINFRHGMGHNYERLEFLGDSFLKLGTTISLFTLMPAKTEFEYHVERMLLVSNKNLFNVAVDRKLHEYIRSQGFNRRSWYPNLKLSKGKAPKTSMQHCLSDKSIADVCEALIGAAYLSCSEGGGMDMAVRAVTKMVKSRNHKMQSFKEYYAAYEVPGWQSTDRVTEAQRAAVESVKEAVGYLFRSPTLLRSAFKHPSYTYEKSIPNYQRLEFLGDALLDMVVVDYLFRQFPTADPQWLTEHKMAMVSNQFLGCLCVQLGLHKCLLVTTSALINQRTEYAASLERAKQAAQEEREAEEAKTAARCDFWREASDPPKALADVVEALIGAMFVDSGYDYTVVQDFFRRLVLPYFEDMAVYDTFANKQPVTALQKLLQNDFGCSEWRVCLQEVPCGVDQGVKAITENDVVCGLVIHGTVVEHATAKSGRYARIACAKKATKRFLELGVHAYRAEVGCDCGGGAAGVPEHGDHGTAI